MSNADILLVTPPFTQLNTPYPATAYLLGFLKSRGIPASQADLGIEVIRQIFNSSELERIFEIGSQALERSADVDRMLALRKEYIDTIDSVINFLSHRDPTLAYAITERQLLPEGRRFEQIEDLEWAFGTLGIQDHARHLATLFLEDLGDFIQEIIDPHFGFSRYAERLSMSANHFDELHDQVKGSPTYIDQHTLYLLDQKIATTQPKLVCLSVPFPGNLYSALRCAHHIKQQHPQIKVAMGGGYANTELRSVSDPRVFEFVDFITLDDGERPVLCLHEYLEGTRPLVELKRTFHLQDEKVVFEDGCKHPDISFQKTGTPDYEGLDLNQYLSVIEVANPMHRLWSDGRWNKLTMAHGCYWKKCSFCDISLDYIANYEPISASIICDRIEDQMAQTGETGFHFVDEAAPPSLMKELALEILKRDLKITWWTNIRFEGAFTSDLCYLLAQSGCIAVSGGLEVASDRLLKKMKKGVTVRQVAQVARNFTESGIMVHAYLMYGFPTQTAQETIDSLEMVRQLFMHGVVQSGFWHLFAMTAHAPVGLEPAAFGVSTSVQTAGPFAHNDLPHEDTSGADHQMFGQGLRTSLYNYMHGAGFDMPLRKWFDFKVPRTRVSQRFIEDSISDRDEKSPKDSSQVYWPHPIADPPQAPGHALVFHTKRHSFDVFANHSTQTWIIEMLRQTKSSKTTITDIRNSYTQAGLTNFDTFTGSEAWLLLRENGLLIL